MAKRVPQENTPRPRLTVDLSPVLKRRIKVAAATQDMPVSAYIARVLEEAVPVAEPVAKGPDGVITPDMMLRAARFRAEQREPFPEDSADLIREARGHRQARR